MRSTHTLWAVAAAAAISGCASGTSTTNTPAPVASVTLSATSDSLAPGGTFQLSATIKDGSGNILTDRATTWTSSSPAAATVSSTGLVTAVAPGATTVTATSEGKSASATITVTTPVAPVASVTLSTTAAGLVPTGALQLTATEKDAAGATLSGRAVTWTTNAPLVATVSSAGLVTAVAIGSATITATSEGKSASAIITVIAGTVVGSAGGTVTSPDGKASVIIPPGALTQPTGISVTPAATFPANALLVAGSAYDFGPSGTQFLVPATVKINYAPAGQPTGKPQGAIQLNVAGASAWTPVVGSTVDTVAHVVQGPTSHFTGFGGVNSPFIVTENDPDGIFPSLGEIVSDITVCVDGRVPLSVATLSGADPGTIRITSSDASIASGEGFGSSFDRLGTSSIYIDGTAVGSATIKVIIGTDTVRMTVTVINTVPPCKPVPVAARESATGSDRIFLVNGGVQALFNSDVNASSPAVGPLGTGAPPVAFLSRTTQGLYFVKTFFDGTSTSEVDVPVTPNTTPLALTFYDPNTLLIVQQSTVDGAGDIYASTRTSGTPIRLTNLHGVINSIASSTNGTLYIDWRPLGIPGPHVFSLPLPSLTGPPVTTGLVQLTTGANEYQPSISQNNGWMAYLEFDAFFNHSQVMVQDLTNPATPPVAISPASGLAFGPQWCGNVFVMFTYSVSLSGPYQPMRRNLLLAPSTPITAVGSANAPELSAAKTSGDQALLVCPK